MRDTPRLGAVALAFTLLAAGSSAAPDVRHYGPFPSGSPDSGTCGNFWAEDTFDRVFTVHVTPEADGTYRVVQQFKNGSFVTSAGASPGGCDTNPGGTVAAGVTGRMQGNFQMKVTGTFNPDAACTMETCGTTAGFVATVFGAGATFDIPTFLFQYSAGRNGHWKNASKDRGGNQGDITGEP
jgi:hypothetical protein